MKMLLRLSAALALAAGCLLHSSLQAGDKKNEKKDAKKEEKGPAKDLVVNGEFTNADLKDRVRTEMFSQYFSYAMTQGRTYQIDLKGDKGLDTYLRLENPDGEQVAEDDDSGGNLDARIIYKAPKTGEFTIIGTTFAPNVMGKFTLIVKDITGRKPDPVPRGKGIPFPFKDLKLPLPPPIKGTLEQGFNRDFRVAVLRAEFAQGK